MLGYQNVDNERPSPAALRHSMYHGWPPCAIVGQGSEEQCPLTPSRKTNKKPSCR